MGAFEDFFHVWITILAVSLPPSDFPAAAASWSFIESGHDDLIIRLDAIRRLNSQPGFVGRVPHEAITNAENHRLPAATGIADIAVARIIGMYSADDQ